MRMVVGTRTRCDVDVAVTLPSLRAVCRYDGGYGSIGSLLSVECGLQS